MTQLVNVHMKPTVLVAARMSSSRLPGKMLMQFGDQPLLSHVVQAVSAAKGTSQVIVVTSQEDSDDLIDQWCRANNVAVWRGELNDVAGRMLAAAKHVSAESFVRISGDSPMIDPSVISYAVERFTTTRPDLVTNVSPKSFPAGQSVEVIRTHTLERLLTSGEAQLRPEDREHVTPILYRHAREIRIERFTPSDMQSGGRTQRYNFRSMAVDTPEDADCFRRVVNNAGGSSVWMHGWEQCEAMMRRADRDGRAGLED